METHQEKASRILTEARQAFGARDYPRALELYEWFFDHALDDPKSGLSGVRLSYCLDGWMQLGQVFEPARVKLEQRRLQSIQDLERTRKSDKFHEFMAICEFTGVPHLAVDQFLEYHRSDRELASIVFGYAKDKLVASEQWQVCSAYIHDADHDYAIALQVFDASARIYRENPSFGDEFEQVYKNRHINEVTNLVAILTHARRFDDAQRICELANKDMKERGLKEFLSVYPEDFEE